MTLGEYQNKAIKTATPVRSLSQQLADGAMGLCGKSGDASELIRKTITEGHIITREEVAKNLGGVLWYVAIIAKTCGLSLDEVAHQSLLDRDREKTKRIHELDQMKDNKRWTDAIYLFDKWDM